MKCCKYETLNTADVFPINLQHSVLLTVMRVVLVQILDAFIAVLSIQ